MEPNIHKRESIPEIPAILEAEENKGKAMSPEKLLVIAGLLGGRLRIQSLYINNDGTFQILLQSIITPEQQILETLPGFEPPPPPPEGSRNL